MHRIAAPDSHSIDLAPLCREAVKSYEEVSTASKILFEKLQPYRFGVHEVKYFRDKGVDF